MAKTIVMTTAGPSSIDTISGTAPRPRTAERRAAVQIAALSITTSPTATHSGLWMIPVRITLSAASCTAARASAVIGAHGWGTRIVPSAAAAIPASTTTAARVASQGAKAIMD